MSTTNNQPVGRISEIVKGFLDGVETELAKERENTVHIKDVTLNEGLLRVAEVHGATVHFRYAKGAGRTIEQRILLNPQVVVSNAGDRLVQGFDPDREEPRLYRLDRIKGVVEVIG